MSRSQQQNTGSLQVERGGQWGQPRASGLNAPRSRTTTPDETFDKTVQDYCIGLKSDAKTERSKGLYPSRTIANTAEGTQFPLRTASQILIDCDAAELDAEAVAHDLAALLVAQGRRVKERSRRAPSVA